MRHWLHKCYGLRPHTVGAMPLQKTLGRWKATPVQASCCGGPSVGRCGSWSGESAMRDARHGAQDPEAPAGAPAAPAESSTGETGRRGRSRSCRRRRRHFQEADGERTRAAPLTPMARFLRDVFHYKRLGGREGGSVRPAAAASGSWTASSAAPRATSPASVPPQLGVALGYDAAPPVYTAPPPVCPWPAAGATPSKTAEYPFGAARLQELDLEPWPPVLPSAPRCCQVQ